MMLSYPIVIKGNYAIKLSVWNGSVLAVADHLKDPKKFEVKHFTDIEDGAAYLDFIIEKDLRENGGY